MTIRTLIVDDEPPARRRLRAMLAAVSDVEIVGESSDGAQAIRMIDELDPDLVLLDVQMPEAGGFEVIEAIDPLQLPAIVFVTAYDEFALRAFQVHALDYLLKPFDQERLNAALARVRERLATRQPSQVDGRLSDLLDELATRRRARTPRFAVKSGGKIRLVDAGEVECITAEGNYVQVHTAEARYLIRDSITNLERVLDGEEFLRVHRSTIVRLSSIQELEPLFQGEYVITLRKGIKVRSSRRYRPRLHEALGIGA